MKKAILFTILFLSQLTFSQTEKFSDKKIHEAEMKSASRLMNFVVNPNTVNYDITYHKLEFTINPRFHFINGKITTTYTALSNMTTITFDFANELTVSAVKKGGVNLSFLENTNNELVITLPTTQTTGSTATIEITYSGAPPITGFNSFTRQTRSSGADVIFTLSEPFGARDWWPCKQDLNDKINSIDVYITAPIQYKSVSNGVEPSAPVIVGFNKTTHFHHGYPIPAYLIAIAVTNYSVYNQVGGTAPNQYPIINYIYPENLASVQPQLDQTPLILNLFENLFEIYPFHNEKYGHAQFGLGGGMEHTTVSFMGSFDRGLIAHEMAHQWFGDKITCGTWKDIWLNEGFATYLASMVIENFDGQAAFIINKTNMINGITSAIGGAVYLTDAEATDVNRIFDGRLSYDKGAMVINMLRFKLGDANFFQGMKNYLADPNLAYKYAVTANLQTHLEAVSGQNLTEFFNDWIYNQGYPTYTITAQNTAPGQVELIVNQTQSHPSVSYFEMPVPVRVFGSGGQQMDLILQNTTNGQIFIENVPFEVTSLEFDPNKNIISRNNTATLGTENFALAQSIQVYPNPTSDVLHIEMHASMNLEKVTIYNNLGQTVLENTTNIIPVSGLPSGVHFIQIGTSEGTFHKKFIKI